MGSTCSRPSRRSQLWEWAKKVAVQLSGEEQSLVRRPPPRAEGLDLGFLRCRRCHRKMGPLSALMEFNNADCMYRGRNVNCSCGGHGNHTRHPDRHAAHVVCRRVCLAQSRWMCKCWDRILEKMVAEGKYCRLVYVHRLVLRWQVEELPASGRCIHFSWGPVQNLAACGHV